MGVWKARIRIRNFGIIFQRTFWLRIQVHYTWHEFSKWSNLTLMWAHLPLFGPLIWPWPLWPLTLTPWPWPWILVTSDLFVTCQIHCAMFENCISICWPLTLTFGHDLDDINVHKHTKFGDPFPNGSWDMNYHQFLVKWQTDGKRCIWAHRAGCTGGLKNIKIRCSNQFVMNLFFIHIFPETLEGEVRLRKIVEQCFTIHIS